MNANIFVQDFPRICRICLNTANSLVSIANFGIITMLKQCASIHISTNDELPNQLCQKCLIDLQNSCKLQTQIKESNTVLQNILEQHKESKINLTDNDINIGEETIIDYDCFLDLQKENTDKASSDTDSAPESKCYYTKDDFEQETKYLSGLTNQCKLCDLTFSHNNHYGLHMKRFHNIKGEPCSECNRIFYFEEELRKHLLQSHALRIPRSPCDICGKYILKSLMKTHLKTHNPRETRETFQCHKCDKKFMHKTSLKNHVLRYHENQPIEYAYICTICGKKCSSRAALERHHPAHSAARPFSCPQCDAKFKRRTCAKKHFDKVHLGLKVTAEKVSCKKCYKSVKKSYMRRHLEIHKEMREIHQCLKCDKQFLDKKLLKRHVAHYHEKVVREFTHLCNICAKGCHSRQELESHMSVHFDDRNYVCQTCGKKYKNRNGLRTHTRTIHLKIKTNPCSICGRLFSTRKILEHHMRTHTGERPFKCAICQRAFAQKSPLTTHMRLVHKISK